jgi:hypothetical protein
MQFVEIPEGDHHADQYKECPNFRNCGTKVCHTCYSDPYVFCSYRCLHQLSAEKRIYGTLQCIIPTIPSPLKQDEEKTWETILQRTYSAKIEYVYHKGYAISTLSVEPAPQEETWNEITPLPMSLLDQYLAFEE